MSYAVKEIFYTLQGEGANAGRPAVFCRFAGCNLWTGREEDREAAICRFCDTDFRGGQKHTDQELGRAIVKMWGPTRRHRFVVFTGGEPLLHPSPALVEALHWHNFT